MKPIRTILCPVDFTDISRRELDLAAGIAGQFRAELVLQHNLPAGAGLGVMWMHDQEQRGADAAREKQARARLAALLDDLPEEVRARAALTYGSLDHCVQHMATHCGADLIVIGAHGGGGAHADHPSETRQLITHAPCPVLTIHDGAATACQPSFAGGDGGERVRTLVPVDFSADHSVRALNYALDLAAHLPLQIIALHVTHRPDTAGGWPREQLAKAVPVEARRAAVTLEVTRLTEAGIAHDIADAERRLGARLVVMGAHSRGVIEALLAARRAIAPQLVHTSPCPVWFVPACASV